MNFTDKRIADIVTRTHKNKIQTTKRNWHDLPLYTSIISKFVQLLNARMKKLRITLERVLKPVNMCVNPRERQTGQKNEVKCTFFLFHTQAHTNTLHELNRENKICTSVTGVVVAAIFRSLQYTHTRTHHSNSKSNKCFDICLYVQSNEELGGKNVC